MDTNADGRGRGEATFAGGCFWCVEADFEKLDGVLEAVSGYAGGAEPDPSYEQVASGATGHREAVRVVYDPAKVSYADLVDWFWRHHDPTDPGGSFGDRGMQYTSAIFHHDEAQRRVAEASKDILDASGVFDRPVVTQIRPLTTFYRAEDYHQDYYKTHAIKYKLYRVASGRDRFIAAAWKGREGVDTRPAPSSGDKATSRDQGAKGFVTPYAKPSRQELKARLTAMQHRVTQEDGTEPPFKNAYHDEKRPGIYVDIVSGEPLFSSQDKYDSGTGWPSFTRPLEPGNIVTREDRSLFVTRTEVRSRHADSHLGHVFEDGPPPTGLRYCMNSAALRFIPKEDLQAEGYGEYLGLFE